MTPGQAAYLRLTPLKRRQFNSIVNEAIANLYAQVSKPKPKEKQDAFEIPHP